MQVRRCTGHRSVRKPCPHPVRHRPRAPAASASPACPYPARPATTRAEENAEKEEHHGYRASNHGTTKNPRFEEIRSGGSAEPDPTVASDREHVREPSCPHTAEPSGGYTGVTPSPGHPGPAPRPWPSTYGGGGRPGVRVEDGRGGGDHGAELLPRDVSAGRAAEPQDDRNASLPPTATSESPSHPRTRGYGSTGTGGACISAQEGSIYTTGTHKHPCHAVPHRPSRPAPAHRAPHTADQREKAKWSAS